MFYRKESDQYILEGMPFVIDGTQYPQNWLNLSTPKDKETLGLVDVVVTGEAKNPTYYWTGETLDGAVKTLTATAKDLVEVQKSAITQINQTAYSLLLPSDWMVVKSVETSTPVPSDWATWRACIRDTATAKVALVNTATTVDEVEAIFFRTFE
jgi:hypothetical protein